MNAVILAGGTCGNSCSSPAATQPNSALIVISVVVIGTIISMLVVLWFYKPVNVIILAVAFTVLGVLTLPHAHLQYRIPTKTGHFDEVQAKCSKLFAELDQSSGSIYTVQQNINCFKIFD